MGAIAPIDFEKRLFAPIDFVSFPYGFDNFLLNSVKKGAEMETCTHRLTPLTEASRTSEGGKQGTCPN